MSFRKGVLAEIDSLITDIECANEVDARKQTKWLQWLEEIKEDVRKATK